MDCPLSTTFLPGIWVMETLARSSQIDVSLLLGFLEKFPQTSDDLGRNARELVSFRILECFLFQGAQSNSLTSSSPKIAFDQSESCEDVLQRILLETPASSLKAAGPDIGKWDVQAFIALKRSTMGKNALHQLKDAIRTGSYYFLASIKEQSGSPFGKQLESGSLGNGGKHDGTMLRFEGTNSSHRICDGNGQLISTAVINKSCLVHSDKPNGNLSPVKQKGRSINIISREKSGKDQITSKDGGEGLKELSEECENEIIHCGQHLGGKLSSSVGDANEVLHCKDQAPHCDIELMNDKSIDKHAQNDETREAKGDKEGLCGPSSTEDMDKLEPHIKDSVQNGEGEGKIQDLHFNTELPHDKYDPENGQNEVREGEAKNDKESFCDLNTTEERDKSEPHSKDNVQSEREKEIHIGCGGQCQYSQYYSTTNCNDLNILADVCAGVGVRQNRTCLESMGQNVPSGDVEFSSSNGLLGHGKVMHHKEQIYNHNTQQNREDGNAGHCEGFLEPKTSSGCKDGFEQEIHRNVTDLGDAEDVIVTGDCDGCLDVRTDIATKKNAFLSSQCSFSQGHADCRELNVCVKCNKGGKLLVCSANSCRLVVHESCLGSHASFSTRGGFQCPFCAYSQAISEYMDIKKKVSLTRKDFATFVCLGAKKELKKQPRRSYMSKQHHLEHDDGLNRSVEPNNQDNAGHNNNRKRRRKLEYEEGCSTLSSGDNSPSGGKAVDSANGKAHPSKNDSREMRQSKMAASATLRSKGENVSNKDPRKNRGSKISPHIESADHQERSEENDDSGAPKYPMRVQKHKRQYTYPKIPGLRRQRVLWTTAEEEKLKEGMRIFYTGEKSIPWRKIMEHGSSVFVDGRSAVDLKDKWRNLSRASPKTEWDFICAGFVLFFWVGGSSRSPLRYGLCFDALSFVNIHVVMLKSADRFELWAMF